MDDNSSPVGGNIGSTLANSTNTGIFPTGLSSVPGSAAYIRYAKLFFKHEGSSGDSLRNPVIYITNANNSNQISIAPDAFWLGIYSQQTGGSANRATLPSGLSSSHFSGYTVQSPLSLSTISNTGNVTLSTGQSIGIWIRERIVAGLSNGYDNSFNLAIRGEIG